MTTLWPRDPTENLAYRLKLREQADRDQGLQRQLVALCRQDILFFIGTFAWLFEPRPRKGQRSTIPFCPYEYQDKVILEIIEHLGEKDIGVEKSRDLGLTWIMLTIFFHQWLVAARDAPVSFGIMSRNMDLVDKSGKTDTLFWKLDFLYWRLPKWMRPKIDRTHGQLTNLDNLSTIEGSPTTGDAFRGGRKTAIALDEYHSFKTGEDYSALAATQHATDCRLFISTPKGPSGAYYDVMHDASDMLRLVCDWKEHPDRKRGLYSTVGNEMDGQLEILDKEYEFPADYKFITDGKVRSPYYDLECRRPGATPMNIAQELDRDYGGAAATFFSPSAIARHKRDHGSQPEFRGLISYDPETYRSEFIPHETGPLRLYCPLDFQQKPNDDRDYGIGCDIAAGTAGDYSSNSCAAVVDSTTRRLVAMFISNSVRPDRFADIAMALGWFFSSGGRPAKLNFEANGIGQQFFDQVREMQYPNIWYREVQQINATKKTLKPGWWASAETKNIALGRISRDFSTEPAKLVIPSLEVLEELPQYVYLNGKVEHSRSMTTQDESAKGLAHGDTVIALALAYLTIPDVRVMQPHKDKKAEPPIGSMAWRMKRYDGEKLASQGRWDDEDYQLEGELERLY
jgi:hypothetical protein